MNIKCFFGFHTHKDPEYGLKWSSKVEYRKCDCCKRYVVRYGLSYTEADFYKKF